MRLACWLAALAPLGVSAQSSDFITQPAGTTNCDGFGTYTAYSQLHLNFQSWILYWTPATS